MGTRHEREWHLGSGPSRKRYQNLLHSPISLGHTSEFQSFLYSMLGGDTDSSLGDDRRSFHQRVDDWGVHSSLPNLTLIQDTRHDPWPDHGDDRPGVSGLTKPGPLGAAQNSAPKSSQPVVPIKAGVYHVTRSLRSLDHVDLLSGSDSEHEVCSETRGYIQGRWTKSNTSLIGVSPLRYRSSIRIMVLGEDKLSGGPHGLPGHRPKVRKTSRHSEPLPQGAKLPIVRPAIRLPKDLIEKMPSPPTTPVSPRKDPLPSKLAEPMHTKKVPKSVASMVRR